MGRGEVNSIYTLCSLVNSIVILKVRKANSLLVIGGGRGNGGQKHPGPTEINPASLEVL